MFAPGLAFVALLTAGLALVVVAMVSLARLLQAGRYRQDRPK
jgi:hypothetical protein